MTLTDIRQILADRNLQLTRSLGQNFLHDGNQLRRIVEAADIQTGERILEIGPGLGPLTERLLEAGARVLAIEKDARLVAVLRERLHAESQGASSGNQPTPMLELLHADALDWLKSTHRSWDGWKLVANLPYSVASPILVELALLPSPPDLMVATLQLEVVKRIIATPGSHDYGMLTLLLALRYEPAGWFKIPSGCFFPAPDVESACVTLKRRIEGHPGPQFCKTYVEVVRTAFSQRRKMVGKLLGSRWPSIRVAEALRSAGVEPSQRAETISRDQFSGIAGMLCTS